MNSKDQQLSNSPASDAEELRIPIKLTMDFDPIEER
jgi:hypothetical protein